VNFITTPSLIPVHRPRTIVTYADYLRTRHILLKRDNPKAKEAIVEFTHKFELEDTMYILKEFITATDKILVITCAYSGEKKAVLPSPSCRVEGYAMSVELPARENSCKKQLEIRIADPSSEHAKSIHMQMVRMIKDTQSCSIREIYGFMKKHDLTIYTDDPLP
jgi:hypothetical protein